MLINLLDEIPVGSGRYWGSLRNLITDKYDVSIDYEGQHIDGENVIKLLEKLPIEAVFYRLKRLTKDDTIEFLYFGTRKAVNGMLKNILETEQNFTIYIKPKNKI